MTAAQIPVDLDGRVGGGAPTIRLAEGSVRLPHRTHGSSEYQAQDGARGVNETRVVRGGEGEVKEVEHPSEVRFIFEDFQRTLIR